MLPTTQDNDSHQRVHIRNFLFAGAAPSVVLGSVTYSDAKKVIPVEVLYMNAKESGHFIKAKTIFMSGLPQPREVEAMALYQVLHRATKMNASNVVFE
ncbi:hypothetical protein JHK87_035508 [Glycine soja]|nr:hypothetical protein JHK87_035508 [Glycine soja]